MIKSYRLCSFKLPFVIKIFVLSTFEWSFYTGFTVALITISKAIRESSDEPEVQNYTVSSEPSLLKDTTMEIY